MTPDDLRPGDALLIIDVQNDFLPGGALPIPNGDRVIPVLNEWIDAAVDRQIPVFASRDWHPIGHPSFAGEGGDWPEHCLHDSPGAAFHTDLRLPDDAIIVTKGTRLDHDQLSAFHDTGLHARMQKDGIRRIWIGGLAQDVCVAASARDAIRHGYEVLLIPEGSLPVRPDRAAECLNSLRAVGVRMAS